MRRITNVLWKLIIFPTAFCNYFTLLHSYRVNLSLNTHNDVPVTLTIVAKQIEVNLASQFWEN